jgi:hypothetical protein
VLPRPDKTIVFALRDISSPLASIRQQLPTIGFDDVLACLDFADGKLGPAALMLCALNKRQDISKKRRRKPYHSI